MFFGPMFIFRFLLLVILLILCGCNANSQESARPVASDIAAKRPAEAAQVVEFCGNCHATPHPDSFPKQAWPKEVSRGYDLYHESFRQDLQPPPIDDVTSYYVRLAPVDLSVPVPVSDTVESPLRFRQQLTEVPRFEAPGVSYVAWTPLERHGSPNIVFCDMRSGEIRRFDPQSSDMKTELLTTANHPAHVETCDLDGDGKDELVLAELGSMSSGDHHRGAVIWLRPTESQKTWEQELLVSGLGRVADIRPSDFDGDGDTDLLVAEFGHMKTGSIFLLLNKGLRNGNPVFERRVIDVRHGTIHVPVADLNQDQRLDFVGLVSQEYEAVDAFLSRQDGSFERQSIFKGPDPSYGSSSIQVADIDADGDLDIVYTNGDTFGSDYLKPYHAIHWLENRGGFPFVDHQLGEMIGVQLAQVADMDRDGDLDILAVALMPSNLMHHPQLAQLDSILWLEQTERGKFVRHSLEKGNFSHAAVVAADFDRDDDIDLAVGNLQDSADSFRPWITIWWNLAKP